MGEEAATAKVFERGDVLFSRLRPYLNKVHLAEAPGYCSTEFYVLRPKEGIDGEYLAVVLRSPLVTTQTRHLMTGNTHPRVAPHDASSLLVPTPPMDVQRAIAKAHRLHARVP